MFAKKYRVTKKEDFDLIFRKGKAFYLDFFVMKVLKNNLEFNRFSVLVSKKVSLKATERNEVKRKIREVLKKQMKILPPNCDIVIYAKKSVLGKGFGEIEERLRDCFGR